MHRGLVAAGLLVLGLLTASPARAASITFDSVSVPQGSDLTLAIRAILEPGEDLFTFSFDLFFDASILTATSVTEGEFLKSALTDFPVPEPDPEDPDAPPPFGTDFFSGLISPGSITFTLGSLFGDAVTIGATGEGVLAYVMFQATGAGPSGLTLANVAFFNASDSNDPFPTTIVNGDVQVGTPTPVPEPSTLGLVLVGLGVMRRRLRRTKTVENQIQ